MLGRGFIIFWIFFRNFLARVEYERNSELKFCFPFFSLSHPVLDKNNAGKRFYNLLSFLLFFSQFSCPCRIWTAFRTKILFSLFRPISSPFWLKLMTGISFINFWVFLQFFSEFSCSGRVWTEFGDKIFFLSFSVYLIPFWSKLMPRRGFIIFWIFLLFF